MPRGWFGERVRHGLAAKGIKTARKRLQRFYRANREMLREMSKQAPDKEWIGDLDLEHGKFDLEDVHTGDSHSSYMSWDSDDPEEAVGYIHFHPDNDRELSVNDYLAGIEIRRRKGKDCVVYIGLVTNDMFEVWAFAPSKGRESELKRAKGNSTALEVLEREMRQKGELIKVLEERL